MIPRDSRAFARAFLCLVTASPAFGQSRFAELVVDYSPGPGANPSFTDPQRALGGPRGGGMTNGSLDIVALGAGGTLTLGFGVTIVDGPGADLIVGENAFVFGSGVFAEVAFVEVSTDGLVFARFPTRYAGPIGPLPPFGSSPMGTFGGLCGGLPGLADVATNAIDPFDPVVAGGEAFDLAELAGDPLVLSGAVDLDAIQYVRIVDVEEGLWLDSFGNVIWDHGGASGSADIDAVSVIHHAGNAVPGAPIADLSIDAQGHLLLELGDADGFADLDLATIEVSANLAPASFAAIRPLLRLHQRTPSGVILRSKQPIVGSGLQLALAISVRDHAGNASADQVLLPG